ATFQQTMNHMFSDVIDKLMIVYLDDLLTYSDDHKDHEQHLRHVLTWMNDNQLKACIHKCCFLQEEVDYLGYIIGNGVICHDPKRLEAITSWPLPKDVTGLRSFLGVTNTLLRFLPMYAKHASALTDLLHGAPAKKDLLKWMPEATQAFID